MYLFSASKTSISIEKRRKKKKIKSVDMINVMTYDLYGSWNNKVGHHSALFHRSGETGMERELNTVDMSSN